MAKVSGKGSIVQLEKERPKNKCRRWQLRVNSGQDPRTGKYKVRTRRITGTYTDATKALRDFIKEVEDDKVQGKTKFTVKEYCERYVDRRVQNKEIAPSTAYKLRSNYRSACNHIGCMQLEKVTPSMLNDMYTAMFQGDTLTGRESGGTHIRHIHNNLNLMFNQAVKEGLLATNPCAGANPPRFDTKEKHAIDPDKLRDFVDELRCGSDDSCAYLLAVCMGLRRGEVCGLSWGDVDFDDMTIHVHHSVDVFGNLKGTKTRAGDRILPMPGLVAEALTMLLASQEVRYDKLNRDRKKACHYKGDPLVITDESPVISTISGRRLNPTTLSRWWVDERGSFGLEGVTFHELRHTFLSELALNGVHPKVMQQLAGHSDVSTTLNIYTHVNLDAKRDAVDVLSKALAA